MDQTHSSRKRSPACDCRMQSSRIDTPQALDAAIEARVHARRQNLLRTARGGGSRLGTLFAGLVALLACAERIVEPKRSGYAAAIACLTIAFVYIGRKTRQSDANRKLRELDTLLSPAAGVSPAAGAPSGSSNLYLRRGLVFQ